ncbi:Histone acetyltransferase p300 [Blattella germanica]|nr:Histone acetyltransferase p300 [Blattella germanica]
MTPMSASSMGEGVSGSSEVRPPVPEPIQPAAGGDKKKKCCLFVTVFKPDELRQALMPTLEKLYRQDPESLPFRQPVDPQALGIPDYFDIVKKAMDLSTVKRKLDTGQYSDPWEYVDDVWLILKTLGLLSDRYTFCQKCFNDIPGDTVTLGDDPTQPQT